MIKHIAFTVYPVSDMARARRFYEEDLGLELTHDFGGRWIEYHLPNGCLAITTMMKGVRPSADSGASISLEVDDVDAMAARLRERGATIKVEPFSTPVCRNVIVLDSEGNALGLHHSTRHSPVARTKTSRRPEKKR